MAVVFMTDREKWRAVAESDAGYDGVFFYGVASTGIFCRPSCRSKMPLPENVSFFDAAAEAEQAGFRPCKRCRPDLFAYAPVREIAETAKAAVDAHFRDAPVLRASLDALGVSRHRLDTVFKAQYGVTVIEYLRDTRVREAKTLLAETGATAADIAYSAGFESLSAFYRHFRRQTGTSPAQYRRIQAER